MLASKTQLSQNDKRLVKMLTYPSQFSCRWENSFSEPYCSEFSVVIRLFPEKGYAILIFEDLQFASTRNRESKPIVSELLSSFARAL